MSLALFTLTKDEMKYKLLKVIQNKVNTSFQKQITDVKIKFNQTFFQKKYLCKIQKEMSLEYFSNFLFQWSFITFLIQPSRKNVICEQTYARADFQQTFTCSKSIAETLEKGVTWFWSLYYQL